MLSADSRDAEAVRGDIFHNKFILCAWNIVQRSPVGASPDCLRVLKFQLQIRLWLDAVFNSQCVFVSGFETQNVCYEHT